MSRFAEQAQSILEAAESAPERSEMTILLGPDGIRLIVDSDWPLDSLLHHHGASTAYRVSDRRGALRVEGREAHRRCLLESNSPARLARLMLTHVP